MKTFFLGLMMALATSFSAMAADNGHSQGEAWLKPVEAQYVCMMNNKVFDKPQMAIQVEGRPITDAARCVRICLSKIPGKA